ncbi:thiF family domain-containing protein [Ditylenchus destructor]|nr:thiF family domain-containing protein [Ditylenchus destructor]
MVWRDEDFLKFLQCKVLVIGAGGIGCELLKNLAMTGFKNISVIDLDTIDISNLNRQFLFRKEHVGKSKAEVASAAVKEMCPDVNIEHFHDSIFSEKFGVSFFQQFAIVLSALDNKGARSHVNRLCLVSGVPLVESGSAGYLGQVSVIVKGKSECYDCVPKTGQKTYPNCTIRNTPSEPIHCIVWAKSLFNQLFGEKDPDNDVAPEVTDEQSDSAQGTEAGSKRKDTRTYAEDHSYDPKLLFNKLFHDDVNYLLKMADLWKERRKPEPLEFDKVTDGGLGTSKELPANVCWSLNKWACVYEDSIQELYEKYHEASKSNGILTWDKDDDASMNFVAACANIRAHIFGIAQKALFDVKSMAGNIIPAIATTNACVAGMIVVEALKIVRGQMDKARWVFINRIPNPRGKILVDEPPYKPNPQCYVCSDKGEVRLKINLQQMPVKHFRNKVLISTLHMISPDVMDLFSNRVIISSEEGESDELMDKTLSELGVQNGAQFDCDDFTQQLEFKIIVFHSADLDAEQFEILENNTEPDKTEDEKKTDSKEEAKNGATSESVGKNLKQVSLDGEENGSCIVAENEITEETNTRKRRSEYVDLELTPKRSHVD